MHPKMCIIFSSTRIRMALGQIHAFGSESSTQYAIRRACIFLCIWVRLGGYAEYAPKLGYAIHSVLRIVDPCLGMNMSWALIFCQGVVPVAR